MISLINKRTTIMRGKKMRFKINNLKIDFNKISEIIIMSNKLKD